MRRRSRWSLESSTCQSSRVLGKRAWRPPLPAAPLAGLLVPFPRADRVASRSSAEGECLTEGVILADAVSGCVEAPDGLAALAEQLDETQVLPVAAVGDVQVPAVDGIQAHELADEMVRPSRARPPAELLAPGVAELLGVGQPHP